MPSEQEDLRFMTLSPFDGAVIFSGASRAWRAWCPKCYDDWRTQGAPIYEPLLWTINRVTICHLHCQPLEKDCPTCGRRSKHLAAYIRPGRCALCDCWLGSSTKQLGQVNHASRYAKELGELLAIAPHFTSFSTADLFRHNLSGCMHVLTGNNVLWFARVCGVSKSSL
jgi:hypothetical protein